MSVETLPLRVAEDSGDAGGAEPNGEMHVYGWRIYDRWRCEGKEEACVPLPPGPFFRGNVACDSQRVTATAEGGRGGSFIGSDSARIPPRILSFGDISLPRQL